MVTNLGTLDGLEGTGTDMERHLVAFDAFGIDSLQDILCEVKSCGGCSDRAYII